MEVERQILLGGIKNEFGSIKTIQGVVSKCYKGGAKSDPVKNISNKNINDKNNIYSRVGNEFEKRPVKENENNDSVLIKN